MIPLLHFGGTEDTAQAFSSMCLVNQEKSVQLSSFSKLRAVAYYVPFFLNAF